MMAQFAVTRGKGSALPLGYHMLTGASTPSALAKVSLGRAEEIAAETAEGVKPTAKMRSMGMASMPGMSMGPPASAGSSRSRWRDAGARLAKTTALMLPLAELWLFFGWRRGRGFRLRLPKSYVLRAVR